MKHFAILITCYNRIETTLAFLASLFTQEIGIGWAMEVFLVDDASPDGTGKIVKATYPQVHVIRGDGNLFWCRGMRLAWENALEYGEFDAFIWLNDDVIMGDGALDCLIRDVETLPADAVVVAATYDGDMVSYSICDSHGALCRPTGTPIEIPNAVFNGNCVWVPMSVVRHVGILSGAFRHAYGDFDYARRLQKGGVPCYLASRSIGVCRRHESPFVGRRFPYSLRSLIDPRGRNLHDVFMYRYRNDGLLHALASAVHVIVLVLSGYP